MYTLLFVGLSGLEPPTSGPPDLRASQLRHSPMYLFIVVYQTKRAFGKALIEDPPCANTYIPKYQVVNRSAQPTG